MNGHGQSSDASGRNSARRRTALITGASGGIGLALAREFARGGHDLVLTARRANVLEEAAGELCQSTGVTVSTHAVDLSTDAGPFDLFRMVEEAGIRIDALVNNAGTGDHGAFVQGDVDRQRAMLVNRQIDAVRATIFRQTMFAEFEKTTHELAEAGEPLTVDRFKEVYRGLLGQYFGPDFTLDDELELECFRIPHFYRAFYVYKYATGMSAAVALAERVTGGGRRELADYLNFLSGGCSKDPLDLLRDAGVDMEQPTAVDAALDQFDRLVEELDELL